MRRKRNRKGQFTRRHRAAARKPAHHRRRRARATYEARPVRRRRRARAAESVAIVHVAKPRRRRSTSSTRRRRRSSPRRQTVIRVRAVRRGRGRRGVSYRTRGRRRVSRAIVIAPTRGRRMRVRVRRVTSRTRRLALENPLTGTETTILFVTGGVGIFAGNFVDRVIATHPWANVEQGGGVDQPDATKQQVYNYQAVAAPMNWKRWAAGVVGAAVPLTIGAYVQHGGWRSMWQGFGIGWGLRTIEKGLQDLAVMLTGKTSFGMRIFADEIAAANAAKAAKAQGAAQLGPLAPVGLAGAPEQQKQQFQKCSNCARQVAVGTGCPCTQQQPAVQQPAAAQGAGAPPPAAPAPALNQRPAQVPPAANQRRAVMPATPNWRHRQQVFPAYR